MHRSCNARTRGGGLCRKGARSGELRCHLHAGRRAGTPMHPNTAAALVQGRQRWVARMREAKAAGQIERFPNGRRARHLPPLARDTTIRKAQRILERLVSMSGNGNERLSVRFRSRPARIRHGRCSPKPRSSRLRPIWR